MDDDEVYVEPVSLPLTRPPMKWGVRYEVFALNGMLAVIAFIATSSFVLGLGVFGITHLVSAYLCQRDPYIFHIFERRVPKRGAIGNIGVWGARSYSP